ncbi:glycine receptor subunit alphaZ1-like isoform X1 [Eriocheir sinensis]|uniref:glycine receptor subunit alphaZ1-like isoform X1 n=1 Tax=Eriocheir sinensis TaxID=95602 RepID=UPI0021C5BEA9|nr:glycine receptor subunit alphaZ1-like isoform X1 [Eriocheir sinensis]
MAGTRRVRWCPLACFLLVSVCLLGQVDAETQRRFLQQILDKDYDVNEWPGGDLVQQGRRAKREVNPEALDLLRSPSEPTVVWVQLFINSFGSLNAANMDYSIDVFLRQRWHDQRLKLTGNRTRITVQDPVMQAKIWKPDTYFNNVKDAEVHKVTMPNILLRIDKNGDVLYSMRVTLTLTCSMEFEDYPFDEQVCGSIISSYANTDDVIEYQWDETTAIDMPDDLEIAQFDFLRDPNTVDDKQVFVTGNFSALKVSFDLRRQNGYHILQTYIPTILIVVISWVSFWLDPNAVPGRVSLGVTTLLTLTTLASGVRAQLPPVSYVKAIDVWIGMCMIMVFGALLEFTFVNWLANKKIVGEASLAFRLPLALFGSDEEEVGLDSGVGDSDKVDSEAAPEETNSVKDPQPDGDKQPKNYYHHAHAIDRLCRGFFPGAFLIFNLIYWPYYLMRPYDPLVMESTNPTM